MEQEFYGLLDDDTFKAVFGSKQNIECTEEFLKRFIDIPADQYDHLVIDNPILPRRFRRDKLAIVDVKLHTRDKRVIQIELQKAKDPDMLQRILFYWAQLFVQQLKRGRDYNTLRPVYCVLICDFDMEDDQSLLEEIILWNKTRKKLWTDLLQLCIIDLKQLPSTDDGSDQWPWLAAFKCKNKKELDMLGQRHPSLQSVVKAAIEFNLMDKFRWWKFDWEKRRRDTAYFRHIEDEALAAKVREESAAIIADKDARITDLTASNADLKRQLADALSALAARG
jgi:predicted transposase/invertase (TIGR01784 family)